MMEICLVPKTTCASQYAGLYLFTSTARMMRPVINLSLNLVEMIGTFEQVYMHICITPDEAHDGVSHGAKSGLTPVKVKVFGL